MEFWIRRDRLFKSTALVVACLFLFNTIATADNVPSRNSLPSRSHLAPPLALTNDDKRTLLEVSLICDKIERQAKTTGVLQLDDIRRWESKLDPLERMAKNLGLLDYGEEVYVKAFNKFIIRYFSPSKNQQRFILAGTKGFLSERDVAPDFRVQIYNVAPFLPPSYSIEDIFVHIINKAGLSRHVNAVVSIFPPEDEKKQNHICEIYENGTLLIHPDFVRDYNDIKRVGLGFLYTFDDGAVRWVDVADAIAYRVALHEIKLPGRAGHGHGYLDESGNFQLSFDEVKADTIGRRYSAVDDAMALWYYHSYTVTGQSGRKVRYDNKEFKRHLDWIFKWGTGIFAESYRKEFPNLTSDKERLENAIDLALLINQRFFADRKAIGLDTSTGRERDDVEFSNHFPQAGKSAFAGKSIEPSKDAQSALPEDLIEVVRPTIMVSKPDRSDPRVEERACIELEKELAGLVAELKVAIAEHKNAATEQDLSAVRKRIDDIVSQLGVVYRDIPTDIHERQPYSYYSQMLKKLKARHVRIYKRIDDADAANDRTTLKRLNQEAIRLNRLLAKVQIRIGGMLLKKRSKLQHEIMMMKAALWSLQGALNSARWLEEELHYRGMRIRGSRRMQQIETTDWLGNLVKTFRLRGFEVEVLRGGQNDQEPQVSIRQKKWINVHTTLGQIKTLTRKLSEELTKKEDTEKARVANRDKAIGKIDMLIELYKQDRIIVRERYKGIVADLNELKKVIANMPTAQAPPRELIADAILKADALIKNIEHPKQSVWTNVEYSGIAAAFRSQIHTIARYEPEYNLILRNKADMDYYARLLDIAGERNKLSSKNRKTIERGLKRLIAWTDNRGFVYPKQLAAIDLKPVQTLIENEDFNEAAEQLRQAGKKLEKGLSLIDRITYNLKKRATALYAEYRDADIRSRIGATIEAMEKRQYDSAIAHVQEVQARYFSYQYVEPGYRRAISIINATEKSMWIVGKLASPQPTAAKIIENLKMALEDIDHKYSLRIAVIKKDGSKRYIFVNPGTTLLGLLNILKEEPAKAKILYGKSALSSIEMFKNVILTDSALVAFARSPVANARGDIEPDEEPEGISDGPAGPMSRDIAAAVEYALTTYLEANKAEGVFEAVLKNVNEPVLLRIPVEILEAIGKENASDILSALSLSSAVVIELFAANGPQQINESVYARYGIQKRPFADRSSRTNTVTLFITGTQDAINATMLQERIGLASGLKPTDTILMPVGLYNEDSDLAGLVRSTTLALRLIKIARDHKNGVVDKQFERQTVDQLDDLCRIEASGDFDLTTEELVNLAIGDINEVIRTIKKLISLLPITPIEPEILRQIYQKAREVLAAA